MKTKKVISIGLAAMMSFSALTCLQLLHMPKKRKMRLQEEKM